MTQRTFKPAGRPDLTLRLESEQVAGRTENMPAGMWWEMRRSDLERFLSNPYISEQLREAFQWALQHDEEVAS